jgi:hypothetical protein
MNPFLMAMDGVGSWAQGPLRDWVLGHKHFMKSTAVTSRPLLLLFFLGLQAFVLLLAALAWLYQPFQGGDPV